MGELKRMDAKAKRKVIGYSGNGWTIVLELAWQDTSIVIDYVAARCPACPIHRPGPSFLVLLGFFIGLLAVLLRGDGALAAQCSTFSLASGESRWFHIGSIYRNISVCNDLQSASDVIALIGNHDPVRLAPGICSTDSGDRVMLRNESSRTVSGGVCRVIGRYR
jgi:hypothetical protein